MWIEIVAGIGIGLWTSVVLAVVLIVYAKRRGIIPDGIAELRDAVEDMSAQVRNINEDIEVLKGYADRMAKWRMDAEFRMQKHQDAIDQLTGQAQEPAQMPAESTEVPKEVVQAIHDKIKAEIPDATADQIEAMLTEYLRRAE